VVKIQKNAPFVVRRLRPWQQSVISVMASYSGTSRDNKGQFVRIRLKTGDKTYVGDVYQKTLVCAFTFMVYLQQMF
jgi:hypothetical protein